MHMVGWRSLNGNGNGGAKDCAKSVEWFEKPAKNWMYFRDCYQHGVNGQGVGLQGHREGEGVVTKAAALDSYSG